MQVVGPTVRAFGLCVDATLKGICEPLSPALDMLLIPHIPDTVAKLAGLFRAMPDLASCLLTHSALSFQPTLAVIRLVKRSRVLLSLFCCSVMSRKQNKKCVSIVAKIDQSAILHNARLNCCPFRSFATGPLRLQVHKQEVFVPVLA